MGDPQFTVGFNTNSWSTDLEDLGVTPILRDLVTWRLTVAVVASVARMAVVGERCFFDLRYVLFGYYS